MTETILTIGTRGSPLALAQAHETRDRLAAAHPDLAAEGAIAIMVIKTTGDMILDKPLAEIGGKGLFTKEIDDAMLRGDINIAVHSMKDVPTWLPDGIVLPCMLEREDVRDAFMCLKFKTIADLPEGAVIGSSSLRRGAQILHKRPDLKVESFRGNVQSRMRKLEEGVVDATMLAKAGLNRLGLAEHAASVIEPEDMLPAVAQGAIGITCREDDASAHKYLEPLTHAKTITCVEAERVFLTELDGSCRTPIAGLAQYQEDGSIRFRGLIVSPDGKTVHANERTGAPEAISGLAKEAADELKQVAGPNFFDFMKG